jgi:hypothetical protein
MFRRTMRGAIPSRDQIGSETPLRLTVAAALAFPDGSMTASGLRRAAVLRSTSSTGRVMAVATGVP